MILLTALDFIIWVYAHEWRWEYVTTISGHEKSFLAKVFGKDSITLMRYSQGTNWAR